MCKIRYFICDPVSVTKLRPFQAKRRGLLLEEIAILSPKPGRK